MYSCVVGYVCVCVWVRCCECDFRFEYSHSECLVSNSGIHLNSHTVRNYGWSLHTNPFRLATFIAAKARIRQGEQFYAPLTSNIEFTCEITHKHLLSQQQPQTGLQQTYWYHNGNLLNYARTHLVDKNFSIDWDPMTQTSRFKLFNVQLSDSGNYTCKPTSAEPTTIRLHVKSSYSLSKTNHNHTRSLAPHLSHTIRTHTNSTESHQTPNLSRLSYRPKY